MSSRLNWQRAAGRDLVRERGYERAIPERKPRGIKNEQAKELAALQRALGLPYSGRGMTARDAEELIAELRQACLGL